ncbi:MAG: ATP-binding protein [Pseudomonadota bacterium]
MAFLATTTKDYHRLLGIYVYYRLSLGLLLGAVHWTGLAKDVFGSARPGLFTDVAVVYIVICVITLFLFWQKKLQPFSTHLLFLLSFDFIALVLMIFASGNITGGLSYLLLIPMAIGSTFLGNQISIGLAAFGTILVLVMVLININTDIGDSRAFFSAGVTGVSLFVTAIAFRIFSDKVQSSEYRAKKQTEQANYLQLISQRIVETMRTGIIVIDRDLRIQLINNAAAVLLSSNKRFQGLNTIEPLAIQLEQWQSDGIIPNSFHFLFDKHRTLQVSFASLDDRRFPSLMLFIEDMQRLNQEAQQLKLASLGRLTASIAHEIRNPLGAISHASQLLNESETIDKQDEELLTIIDKHSQRINFIINNILGFSRRKGASPEFVNVTQWLRDFKQDYLQHHPGSINIESESNTIYAKIDPNHLYQIVSNLVDNGMRHTEKHIGEKKISILIGIETEEERPYLQVVDYGEGIPAESQNKIFEPFFTTESTGSGLGLYLCKELSEANQAELRYDFDTASTTSRFILLLAHPQRKIELK